MRWPGRGKKNGYNVLLLRGILPLLIPIFQMETCLCNKCIQSIPATFDPSLLQTTTATTTSMFSVIINPLTLSNSALQPCFQATNLCEKVMADCKVRLRLIS